ncbi:MAG: V-type ATP synthase subunit D [bacterium]|nr:V-type ATP synthase subunit D [bacterium]
MEHVSPTRMNLLAKKGQLKIALQGANLLKKKRDALMEEFIKEARSLADSRDQLNRDLQKGISVLIVALAVDGFHKIRSTSFACQRDLYVKLTEKNIWGIKVAEVEKIQVKRRVYDRGYSLVSTSSRIDEVALSFEEIVEQVIDIAPTEVKIKRLGEEIQKTSRRISALEQKLIPSLGKDIGFIQEVLSEREREDIYRLKKIKKKRGKE